MRIAILDLGTNTFHCLIVSIDAKGAIKRLFKSKTVVKLGEGIHEGIIAPNAFARGVKAIQHYRSVIDTYKPDTILGFATSAVRSASNGLLFLQTLKEETGITIEVISGDREAELIYYGVRSCVELSDQPELIMDIGGGSTEFIIANKDQIFWKHSFELGASRLIQMFNPSDPLKEVEIQQLENYFGNVLKLLFEETKKYSIERLVGSSGSFDTLAEMIGYRFHGRNLLKDKNAYHFNLEEYFKLHEILVPSTILQRSRMKGLIKMRIDMIVIASMLTAFTIRQIGISKMTVSKFALKEGAMFEFIENKKSLSR